MDSRIILNLADFSENNIGRYIELNDFTKKILVKQKQYREDSNEAVALNDFVEYLLDNHYIGGNAPKFKVLLIPALASSHDELLFNLAAVDGNGYPVNAMREAEINAEVKSLFPIKDSMERTVALGSTSPNTIIQSDYNAKTLILHGDEELVYGTNFPSRSIFVYNTNNPGGTVVLQLFSFLKITNSTVGGSWQAVDYGYTPTSVNGFLSSSYDAENQTYEVKTSEDINITTKDAGVVTNEKVRINDSNTTTLRIVPYVHQDSRHPRPALICYSEYLSPSEMEELKEKVERLMRALHVVDYKNSL